MASAIFCVSYMSNVAAPRTWSNNFKPMKIKPPLCSAVLAEKNPLDVKYREHVLKYTAALRHPFGMFEAADYLESWVDGTLEESPLLDVSACPVGIQFTTCFCFLVVCLPSSEVSH